MEVVYQLSLEPFQPSLKTHKLSGFPNCWACSAGYDLRIIFEFQDNGSIFLLSIGTHDEVY
jgi:mRNA-degrading endonuclease YafQ of YafQ-DinJ toxin-antitoxin module